LSVQDQVIEDVFTTLPDSPVGPLGEKPREKLVKVGVIELFVVDSVIKNCAYLLPSVTHEFEEISEPDEIAVQDPNAVAPDIPESLEVLIFTVTDVFVGVVAA